MEMLCSIIHTSANSLQNYGWSLKVWRLWSDVTNFLFFVRSSTCTAATAASASVICAPASHTEAARRSSPSSTLPLIEEWPLTCRSASSSRVWAEYNDSEPTSTGSHTSIKHLKIFLSLLCLFTAVFLGQALQGQAFILKLFEIKNSAQFSLVVSPKNTLSVVPTTRKTFL